MFSPFLVHYYLILRVTCIACRLLICNEVWDTTVKPIFNEIMIYFIVVLLLINFNSVAFYYFYFSIVLQYSNPETNTAAVRFIRSRKRSWTSAVRSTNLESILIFANCVVGTCSVLMWVSFYWEESYFWSTIMVTSSVGILLKVGNFS